MQNRRQILKTAAFGAIGLATIVHSRSALAYSPSGLQHQNWFHDTSFDLASDQEMADKDGKILAILWERKGCGYCRKLHEIVFQQPDIVELIREKFLVVQMNLLGDRRFRGFDGETVGENQMARTFKVRGTPSTLFFDGIGKEVFRMPGYGPPPVSKGVFQYVHEKGYKGQSFPQWYEANG